MQDFDEVMEAAFCKEMSLTGSKSPSEGSLPYLEDVESFDRKALESSLGGAENDIFFDPLDIIFSIGDVISPNMMLDDIEPLDNPLASSLIPQVMLDICSFSSKHGMAPAPSESTVEHENAGWLPNLTFEPLSYPSTSNKGDDSIEARSSDVSFPISDSIKEDEIFTSNGCSSIVSYCHEELHDLRTRMQREASPSRVQTQRQIWGIGRTSNQQNSGRTRVDHWKSYKPNGSCSNDLTQKRLTSFGSTTLSKEIKSSRHGEGYMQDDLCVWKQNLGTAAHKCKAGYTRVAFLGAHCQSDHGCTLLKHQDSDNSDGMEDSLLDESNGKINRCQKKVISRNLISERRRRRRLNDKLYALRALVPLISKMDKASIVADAINYVRELKRQVYEMQVEVSHLRVTKEALSNGAVMHSSPLLSRSMVSHQQQHQIVKVTSTLQNQLLVTTALI